MAIGDHTETYYVLEESRTGSYRVTAEMDISSLKLYEERTLIGDKKRYTMVAEVRYSDLPAFIKWLSTRKWD